MGDEVVETMVVETMVVKTMVVVEEAMGDEIPQVTTTTTKIFSVVILGGIVQIRAPTAGHMGRPITRGLTALIVYQAIKLMQHLRTV